MNENKRKLSGGACGLPCGVLFFFVGLWMKGEFF